MGINEYDLYVSNNTHDYYNPGTEIPGVAEVNIVKNRSGQTGKVELFFSKEFTQFSNYSKQEQQ